MKGKISFLIGITLGDFIQVLKKNKHSISIKYLPDFILNLFFSIFNSFWAYCESKLFDPKIQATLIEEDPIFILGHWRSGTTHLQYTLSQDPSLYTPTTFETLFPKSYILTHGFMAPLLGLLVPKKRVQDNMDGGLEYPNEDEIALAVLTGYSILFKWAFPKESRFDCHLSFSNAPVNEREAWKKALLFFVKKLSFRNPGKRILLKSPAHTARIEIIREVFPNAKFIHINRDPQEVFRSTLHLYHKFEGVYAFLQSYEDLQISETIFELYQMVYHSFLDSYHKGSYPISFLNFSEFSQNPINELERVYKELGINGFDKAKMHLISYLESVKNYQKIQHQALADDLKNQVDQLWKPIYEKVQEIEAR